MAYVEVVFPSARDLASGRPRVLAALDALRP